MCEENLDESRQCCHIQLRITFCLRIRVSSWCDKEPVLKSGFFFLKNIYISNWLKYRYSGFFQKVNQFIKVVLFAFIFH